ncbi:hypothetical protein CBM2592_A110027 [Cupriavidus taiwanensis]|nr:hypothetical protein CBM2592_A110027 [Cupriavidus taiwanensis]SOY58830.1 hypothetical protein CBM2588_A80028 [Cupriavidus taiwanensis]SOY80065.1 hypothetical protein CBM2591_A120028 [Cupriavidus taiwanensis]SOZ50801.1 hypothetical protein CBM2617_A110027 [Cupriavidus taiwanensis]SOZ75952.1 hypothetical protein CBM2622_A110027 [Cupriavidus taiwanensis]
MRWSSWLRAKGSCIRWWIACGLRPDLGPRRLCCPHCVDTLALTPTLSRKREREHCLGVRQYRSHPIPLVCSPLPPAREGRG